MVNGHMTNNPPCMYTSRQSPHPSRVDVIPHCLLHVPSQTRHSNPIQEDNDLEQNNSCRALKHSCAHIVSVRALEVVSRGYILLCTVY